MAFGWVGATIASVRAGDVKTMRPAVVVVVVVMDASTAPWVWLLLVLCNDGIGA